MATPIDKPLVTFYPLRPDDTIDALVARAAADREAVREHSIRTAKNRNGQLVAAGVISYDDGYGEMVRSFQWSAAKEEAEKRGDASPQAINTVLREHDQERARESVRGTLRATVAAQETDREWSARVETAMGDVFGTVKHRHENDVHDTGRACKHLDTKVHGKAWINEIGYHQMQAADESGRWHFKCTRCGEKVVVDPPTEPTEQAKLAAALLEIDQRFNTAAAARNPS